jgi:formylglycine-generating enzyme required for sulfatase activity
MGDKTIDQSGQTVHGDQVNVAGDAKIDHFGDKIGGDRIAGDKIIIMPGESQKPHKPFDPKIEPETMLIPAGPFLMGSHAGQSVDDNETPQHEVILTAYRIGRFPITESQYERFIRGNKKYDAPITWFSRRPPEGMADHPVCGVSWYDAMAYCRWLGEETGRRYRLPSEAEWEKGASWTAVDDGEEKKEPPVTRKRIYPWGNEWIERRCNVDSDGTTSVFAHPAGVSAYGVADLLGNVQEWTRSLWGSDSREPEFGYPYDPDDDGREVEDVEDLPAQMRIVHRGGSYKSQPDNVSNTQRSHAAAASRTGWRGFRVVLASE